MRETCLKFCPMASCLHPVPGHGEVLANGTEAAEKRLRALQVAKSLHLTLTPARGQVEFLLNTARFRHMDKKIVYVIMFYASGTPYKPP